MQSSKGVLLMVSEKEILDFAKSRGYETIYKSAAWRGYTIYEFGFEDNQVRYIGLPYFGIIDNGNIRLSTAEETMEWLSDLEEE